MKKTRKLFILAVFLFALSLCFSKKAFADANDPVDIGTFGTVAFVNPQDANLVYTGNALEPGVTVTCKGVTLSAVTDYDLVYSNNIYPGTATIQVSGKGNYKGINSIAFNIAKADQALTASLNPAKLRLKGKTKIIVTGNQGALTFRSSKPAVASVTKYGVITGRKIGTTTIVVNAVGNGCYNPAVLKVNVKVFGQQMTRTNTKITLSKNTYTYDGKKKTPVVTVKFKGRKLKKNRDYKVYYQDNVNAGRAIAVVKGIKQYDGTVKKAYRINKAKNVLNASISKDYVDLHKKIYVKVKKANGIITFKSNNYKVASVDADGVVTGKKNGTCTITVTAAGDINHNKGTKTFKIRVGTKDINDKECKVTLAKKEIVYDGTFKLPYVNATYAGQTMKLNRDYTLKYSNNKNAGQAMITMKGKGNYKGTRKIPFTIKKAYQNNFKASIPDNRIPLGGTAQVTASGYKGSLSYGCLSPSYVKNYKNGIFKGLKETKDGITVTVTASGDENYRSKTIELWVQIN
ncbi:MAG: Ig-like domain-containing protein [Eubacterium sp.]|nr:Ig-like domain-containing protein [Eubacterium sp.]